jgi:phosphatidylserine/phosphatidylglycerophosphate/cardiolipin synthase-like enzyme
MTSREFVAELAQLVRRLSDRQVVEWCDVLESVPEPEHSVLERLITRDPGAEAFSAARRLVTAWSLHGPQSSGAAVALALSTAAAVQREVDYNRPRLVVSGPVSGAVPVRLTGAVVGEVVSRAAQRLLVVSFAAYGVAEVVRQILAAAHRGVHVDLVMETSTAAGEVFTALRDVATFWHWPAEHRAGSSSLHAKVVVADGETALLGSANLTDRGLNGNIEVGVLSHDGAFASTLDGHFRALMRPEARCFTRWG